MKKNNTSLYLVAILAVALLIGVGYAALTATLNINGQTEISKTTWDVHFENVSTNDPTAITFYAPDDTAMSSPIANISGMNATTLNYKVALTGLDKDGTVTHDMSVDVVNNGTIDATISSATLPSENTLTSNADTGNAAIGDIAKLLTISCAYSDGTAIAEGDVIAAGSSKTITCKHHYKAASELTNSDLTFWTSVSQSQVGANLALTLNFYAK